ncbi:M28 family metallopeptidase [Brumimicrobium aurantiacum]|uniref:Aminopeptidase n=1 Tax=Brumimicrobium aurantiacum TaxID=1737063 RepID=A0A3E1F2B5_9FLAO|nr:M28 family peptidase [Brumimicrobium aurantiacum]RFC55968.1 aminopeptidase [Brumimicrobium aurantiacum]
MWTKLLLFIGIILPFLVFSQEDKARRITEVLCSDSLYGRGYLHNGVNKAADFLKDEFQKSGLQPYFGDTSYFQSFSFGVNTFPHKVELKSKDRVLTPGKDFLIDPSSGGFKGDLDLVLIDSTILYDEGYRNTKLNEVLNGDKNGFYVDFDSSPVQNEGHLTFQLNQLSAIGPLVYVSNQKLMWAVGREQFKNPVFYVKPGLLSFDEDISAEVDAKMISHFESRNVAGYLPAKKQTKNTKTIVFTAHYDHLGGMGTEVSTYFPGANDNASGTAMLVSMADYFVENPSEYNMLFIAFAGEEAGLLGSEYFVEHTEIDLSDIKFLLNLDIMGSGEEGITAVNGRIHKEEFELLESINAEKEYLTKVKARGETRNSDHYHFHLKNVPSFFIYTMGPNKNYHDIYDTYDELTFSAYNNIIHLIADFVKEL